MKSIDVNDDFPRQRQAMDPFRRAVWRGLAILLPPLLTIVFFLWVGNTVAVYLLEPLEKSVRWVMVEKLADIRMPVDPEPDAQGMIVIEGQEVQLRSRGRVTLDETVYQQAGDGRFVPLTVAERVRDNLGNNPMPPTAKGVYERYVNETWLQRRFVVPIFLCLFILVLYLLGKFLAAGIGRFFWNQLERLIHRVPLVRNVYSSVKQITDFLFTEPDLQYTRVVAVEYPRKGIWALAFATGEGFRDLRAAANEPILSVLIPTSPMPFTGFTVTVRRSETIDLDISVDQALQFIVSCGVVVPPHQLNRALAAREGDSADAAMALSAPMGDDD